VPDDTLRGDQLVSARVLSVTDSRLETKALVGQRARRIHLVARSPVRQLARHETALGPDRHDDGVLDVLRLGQPEHLGAEVFRTGRTSAIRHGQSCRPCRCMPSTSVECTKISANGTGAGMPGTSLLRILKASPIGISPWSSIEHMEVGAHDGRDDARQVPHDPVVVETGDILQGFAVDGCWQLLALLPVTRLHGLRRPASRGGTCTSNSSASNRARWWWRTSVLAMLVRV
jgi:hypothetical protein